VSACHWRFRDVSGRNSRTGRDGLEASGLDGLQNAIENGVRVDVVNPMVFDYYDRVNADMGDTATSALNGLHAQTKALWPLNTDAELWAMTGATIMNGLDDYPRRTEVTTVQDAQQRMAFASDPATRMSTLSMSAIQRDNGGCPGDRLERLLGHRPVNLGIHEHARALHQSVVSSPRA
jgi:hypothetical protein